MSCAFLPLSLPVFPSLSFLSHPLCICLSFSCVSPSLLPFCLCLLFILSLGVSLHLSSFFFGLFFKLVSFLPPSLCLPVGCPSFCSFFPFSILISVHCLFVFPLRVSFFPLYLFLTFWFCLSFLLVSIPFSGTHPVCLCLLYFIPVNFFSIHVLSACLSLRFLFSSTLTLLLPVFCPSS